MKQDIRFTYTEEYLPTPRCRKFREREVESSISVNIKECSKEEAPLVMLVKEYEREDCEIRAYKGKLYRNAQGRDMERGLWQNESVKSIDWQSSIWGNAYYNACRWSGLTGDSISKGKIRERAKRYLVVGNMIFERTTEPVYQITCFGLNHSAGMFVEYSGKDSSQMSCYSALQREECHKALLNILSLCREKSDNSDFYDIKVLAPEYVKFKRKKRISKK